MSKMLGNLAKGSFNIDDKMILASMISAANANATVYLSATLTATTPELRAFYASGLTQAVEYHTALTGLALTKGWIKPYDEPIKQLSCALNKSDESVE